MEGKLFRLFYLWFHFSGTLAGLGFILTRNVQNILKHYFLVFLQYFVALFLRKEKLFGPTKRLLRENCVQKGIWAAKHVQTPRMGCRTRRVYSLTYPKFSPVTMYTCLHSKMLACLSIVLYLTSMKRVCLKLMGKEKEKEKV